MVGVAVDGTAVDGCSVVGTAVLGRDVVGTAVLGLAVVGSAVVGCEVVGRAVLGLAVVGSAVLGRIVDGTAVVSAALTCKLCNRPSSQYKLPTVSLGKQPAPVNAGHLSCCEMQSRPATAEPSFAPP